MTLMPSFRDNNKPKEVIEILIKDTQRRRDMTDIIFTTRENKLTWGFYKNQATVLNLILKMNKYHLKKH